VLLITLHKLGSYIRVLDIFPFLLKLDLIRCYLVTSYY
jgi:hypothetical protein